MDSGSVTLVSVLLHMMEEEGVTQMQALSVNTSRRHKTHNVAENGLKTSICLAIPPAVRAEFEAYVIENRTQLIQRVSKKSFVVVTSPSSEAPFGLLHIRTGPNNNIQCTCHKYKRATSLASATTAPKLSKRCSHFYLFLWATLSNESLKKEFSLSDSGEYGNNNTGFKINTV